MATNTVETKKLIETFNNISTQRLFGLLDELASEGWDNVGPVEIVISRESKSMIWDYWRDALDKGNFIDSQGYRWYLEQDGDVYMVREDHTNE